MTFAAIPDHQNVSMPITDPLLDPARLTAIRELDLERDDASTREALGQLNRLAQRLLGVPMSVVSIVSDRRHINASQANQSDAFIEQREHPLSHSFCQHVARSGDALIVNDAREHPDVSSNLAVRDHNVIAYAGLPLRLHSGEVVGAFCAVDHHPRRWTGEQLEILKELTAVAITILDQRRANLGAGMRDVVTGLPRLPLFTEQLRDLLTAATASERVAVVAVNLADFKLLNDALGHDAGDQVLAEVGLRLEQLANAQRRQGRVARLVADTFLVAVTVSRTEPRGHVEHDLLRALIDRPVTLDGQSHPLGARVATVAAQPDTTATDLIAAASAAIEDARLLDASEGVSLLASQGPARERLMIRNRLHGAEQRDELSLDYQPVYDLAAGAITGVEALVRWHHPELGSVPPDRFIPVAESSGAIVVIGEWVLGRALTDLAVWRDRYPALDLGLSVNVAPEQLLVPAFATQVAQALEVNGVPAAALTLEITERTLGHDQPTMQATLTALRQYGVRLSLDDFGTGYSSLRRLTASPLDELKLDRLFIANLASDGRRQAVIAGITAMSRALGMRVVAEGIETDEQHELLGQLGCGHGQGYLLAKPTPVGGIDAMLRRDATPGQARPATGTGERA